MKVQRLAMVPSRSSRVAISMRPSPFGMAITRETASGPALELMVEQRRQAPAAT